MRKIIAVTAAGLIAAGAFVLPTSAGGNKYPSESVEHECGDDGTVTLHGPPKLWPPNHKYVDYRVQYTDPDDDSETLVTEGTHDEFADGEEMNGAGNTDNDVDPATDSDTGDDPETSHALRAERSGRGDGRVYTIMYEVSDGGDSSICTGTFTVEVPHDMRGGADWK